MTNEITFKTIFNKEYTLSVSNYFIHLTDNHKIVFRQLGIPKSKIENYVLWINPTYLGFEFYLNTEKAQNNLAIFAYKSHGDITESDSKTYNIVLEDEKALTDLTLQMIELLKKF